MSDIHNAIMALAARLPDGYRVLDVGCGLRPYEYLFSHGTYIGIDVSQSGRAEEGKKMDYEFDGINIPFSAEDFDFVLCTQVLEHATEPEKLLNEIERVLKKGGQLFLTVPFIWGVHELPYDFRRYTDIGIQTALKAAGLEIIKAEKLTKGIDAIKMIVSSETNNYIENVIDKKQKDSWKFRFILRTQGYLLKVLYYIWRRNLQFERIYIDNLVVAEKAITASSK